MVIKSLTTQTTIISGETLYQMGDVGPCELIDGRIVHLSPTGGRHGVIETRISAQLSSFVEAGQLGWVLSGEVGIYTGRNPDRIRAADVAFISHSRLPDGLPDGFLANAPELIVEIISPSDRWLGVRDKLVEYFAAGVSHVWVVEPKNESVLDYQSPEDATAFSGSDGLPGKGLLTGFQLNLADLFRE